jgi:hypothetical protein
MQRLGRLRASVACSPLEGEVVTVFAAEQDEQVVMLHICAAFISRCDTKLSVCVVGGHLAESGRPQKKQAA